MAEENETTTGAEKNNSTTTYTINGHIKADDFILKGTAKENDKENDKSILELFRNNKVYTICTEKDTSEEKGTNIYNTAYIDNELENINKELKNKTEINDDAKLNNKTYSSLKINELISSLTSEYITENQLNKKLETVATINNTDSSENDTYSSSKINELINSLKITSDPELLAFTREENTWTVALGSNSKIITKDNSGNLILNNITSDAYLKSSKLITRKLSFRNNDTAKKTVILKAYNNNTTSDIEITLPSDAGTVALTKNLPSFEVDSDGYLNITTNI